MPYALFSNDARLSKAYPTEADVWKVARTCGLVDVATEEEKANPHPVLDNHYEIRPCDPEPNEDPARNKVEAEGDAWTEPKKAKGGAAMTRLLLLLLFVLLAPRHRTGGSPSSRSLAPTRRCEPQSSTTFARCTGTKSATSSTPRTAQPTPRS